MKKRKSSGTDFVVTGLLLLLAAAALAAYMLLPGGFRGAAKELSRKLDLLAQEGMDASMLSDWVSGLWKLEEDVPEGMSEEEMIGGKGSGIVNFLLIGEDGREGQEGSRSDSMILCTFRPKDKTLVMTSVLRDLYVPIPGHEANRINAAYALGGSRLLKQTLREAFGIRVDGTVTVDFRHFPEIIDALGGVTLELSEAEAAEINRLIPWAMASAGTCTLSGEQALVYSRIRKLDSDFGRSQRQRKVLSSLLQKVLGKDSQELLLLGKLLLPYVKTDLNKLQLLNYGRKLLPMLSGLQVKSQLIPRPEECQDKTIRGMAVLVPDIPRTRAFLRQTLLDK